jgi:hypothetical protein
MGELQPVAASAKEKEKNDDQQDEAEPTTAVVADAWPHVVAAPAGQHKKNHENEYQWHKRSRSSAWGLHDFETALLLETTPAHQLDENWAQEDVLSSKVGWDWWAIVMTAHRQRQSPWAAGAALGCVGLAGFAMVLWIELPMHNPLAIIVVATATWAILAYALWALRKG